MIRVAIVGCGKIADSHAGQIRRIPDCRIVGTCDKEELMAKQFCDRYDVKHFFTDAKELIQATRPEIVHITTPPQSHFELAKICLEAGCHVYVEKPFTVNTGEAEQLIAVATDKDLKITVGHDDQFTHATRRMRELIKRGYLGGAPVHMESYYCYGFGSDAYAKALLGDKNHWVRKLPGKLLQNVISHGISRIAEFMTSETPQVIAHGFTSDFLKRMKQDDIIDELRVIINDSNCSTAYFTFSSQMRPALKHFRIYGPVNGLILDHDQQTVIKLKGTPYKSYVEKFVPPFGFAKQYVENASFNIRKFLIRDFHMKSGTKFLIESFYHSVVHGTPLPISYREILLTSRIMDTIFEQVNPSAQMGAPTQNDSLATRPELT
jgi:predicted dehydrogenase